MRRPPAFLAAAGLAAALVLLVAPAFLAVEAARLVAVVFLVGGVLLAAGGFLAGVFCGGCGTGTKQEWWGGCGGASV